MRSLMLTEGTLPCKLEFAICFTPVSHKHWVCRMQSCHKYPSAELGPMYKYVSEELAHAYTLGKNFPIVSFLWGIEWANTCPHVSNISAPLKHSDCLLHWLELHNTMFQMISFSLASYNFRRNPLLHALGPYVYGFYFYFASSSVFLLPFHPTCFEFV